MGKHKKPFTPEHRERLRQAALRREAHKRLDELMDEAPPPTPPDQQTTTNRTEIPEIVDPTPTPQSQPTAPSINKAQLKELARPVANTKQMVLAELECTEPELDAFIDATWHQDWQTFKYLQELAGRARAESQIVAYCSTGRPDPRLLEIYLEKMPQQRQCQRAHVDELSWPFQEEAEDILAIRAVPKHQQKKMWDEFHDKWHKVLEKSEQVTKRPYDIADRIKIPICQPGSYRSESKITIRPAVTEPTGDTPGPVPLPTVEDAASVNPLIAEGPLFGQDTNLPKGPVTASPAHIPFRPLAK